MNGEFNPRYSPQYVRMQREAHKRGTFAVGAPSFSWHLGYIVEQSESDNVVETELTNGQKEYRDLQSEIAIENFARDLFKSIVDNLPSELIHPGDAHIVAEARRQTEFSGTKSLFFSVDGVLVKVLVSDHSDHFTSTVIVDLSKPGRLRNDPESDRVVRISSGDVEFCQTLQQHMKSYARGLDDDRPEDSSEFRAAVEYMRTTLWEVLYRTLFANSIFDTSRWHTDGNSRVEIFADFRGALIDSQDPGWQSTPSDPIRPQNIVAIEEPYATPETKAEGLNAVLPIVRFGQLGMKYTELVACTIFRNRAVYVSPLGARPFNSTANEKTDPIPLYFAIAVSESNRWQIGRVVRRINSMGCLRLLALRDLEKIKRASNEIRRIGGELDERFQNQTMEVRHKEEEIARARDRLAALKGEMDRIGNDIVGHLPYRIYRAKFRSEQFQRQVDDLFVNRIEGWQPYDEFVRRRLYPTYDFIARVGERYDRLNRNYQNQLLSLDSEMQSVSSSHLVEIQSDILRSHSFQHFIETIALAYYGGYLAYFLSKPYYKELAAVAKPYVPFSMADLPEGLLSLRTYATTEDEHKAFVFACSTTIALLRLWYNVRQHKKKLQVFDERTSHIIKKHA